MKENKYIKEFDKHFTRDDGLIDKYSWYGVEDEPHPQPTPKAIKQFILKALASQRKEIIEKIVTYFGHILNDGNGKPKRISIEKIGQDLKNLIKEDDAGTII